MRFTEKDREKYDNLVLAFIHQGCSGPDASKQAIEQILMDNRTHNHVSAEEKKVGKDPWSNRAKGMVCATCVFFVEKRSFNANELDYKPTEDTAGMEAQGRGELYGRCRRHAPTLSGFPAVFGNDWCGDHRLDENKIRRTEPAEFVKD